MSRKLNPSVAQVVESVYRAPSYEAAHELILDAARSIGRCESALIRLDSGDGWIPAHTSRGLSRQFIRDEQVIAASECMCGRVASGRTDPSAFFFTRGGSFVTNDGDALVRDAAEQELGPIRGRCLAEGYKTIAVFPLKDRQRIVGVLHIASPDCGRLTASSVRKLESICAHAGGALSSSDFSSEREEALVASIAEALLPAPPASLSGLAVGFASQAAYFPSAIGGDFYDLFALGGPRTALIVGDFCGHGISAAGLAARSRFTISTMFAQVEDPASTLLRSSAALMKSIPADRFATAAAVLIDGRARALTVSLAGHPSPILVKTGGESLQVGVAAPPLAIEDDPAYENQDFEFAPGDTLIAYTDGLSDARDERGALFGHTRVMDFARQLAALPAQRIADELCGAVDAFSGRRIPTDDKLIVVIKNELPV